MFRQKLYINRLGRLSNRDVSSVSWKPPTRSALVFLCAGSPLRRDCAEPYGCTGEPGAKNRLRAGFELVVGSASLTLDLGLAW